VTAPGEKLGTKMPKKKNRNPSKVPLIFRKKPSSGVKDSQETGGQENKTSEN